jgi:hypothetical protein
MFKMNLLREQPGAGLPGSRARSDHTSHSKWPPPIKKLHNLALSSENPPRLVSSPPLRCEPSVRA